MDCILARWLYPENMFDSDKSSCIRAKVVVFGQSDCIREKVVVFGQK